MCLPGTFAHRRWIIPTLKTLRTVWRFICDSAKSWTYRSKRFSSRRRNNQVSFNFAVICLARGSSSACAADWSVFRGRSQISSWATLTRGPSFSSSSSKLPPFAFICFLSFSFCFLTVSTLCQSKKKGNKKTKTKKKVIAYIRMCKCTITIKY